MANRCKNCGWPNAADRENCEKCNAPLSTDVFISYSRKDYVVNGKPITNSVISKIRKALEDNHISYWFDEDGIYSGDEFAGVITRAIRTSQIFLFVSSKNSNQSLWTSNEISTALEYKKVIIPFRLDESPYNDSVMMKIVSLDRIDCKNEDIAISKLVRAIRHHLPEKKSPEKRFFKIPQSAVGATVIMDVGGKRVKQVMAFNSNQDQNTLDSTTIFNNDNDYIKSEQEIIVSDDISVHITDKKTPIVMLMGPTAVGKTMTLVRLVRYLLEQGYSVQPDRNFRPTSDVGYGKLCDSFQELVNSAYAANGTSRLDCMLIKIIDRIGRCVLQIVDVAGEFYYDESNSTPLPPSLSQILHSSNPFIWVVMIEPYWRDSFHRLKNVEKIRDFKQQFFRAGDKVIIVCNKTDKLPFFHGKNKIAFNPLFNLIREEYPGMVEIFENANPITKLFRKYNCSVVPFSTGTYTQTRNDRMIYTPSSPNFPYMLWKELTK